MVRCPYHKCHHSYAYSHLLLDNYYSNNFHSKHSILQYSQNKSYTQYSQNKSYMQHPDTFLALAFIILAVSSAHTTPAQCDQIGDSALGFVTNCNVINNPLPFQWEATVKLYKDYDWAGDKDLAMLYSNPDGAIEGKCDVGAPLPAHFTKGSTITFSNNCRFFTPPLAKHATLAVIVFYTRSTSFDDVLMFNYPIPGFSTEEDVKKVNKADLFKRFEQIRKEKYENNLIEIEEK